MADTGCILCTNNGKQITKDVLRVSHFFVICFLLSLTMELTDLKRTCVGTFCEVVVLGETIAPLHTLRRNKTGKLSFLLSLLLNLISGFSVILCLTVHMFSGFFSTNVTSQLSFSTMIN